MSAAGLHLSPNHTVASVAAGHCAGHTAPMIGGVACGVCWERAIRDDERFVVEFELPRELEIDPHAVDDVAVDRACVGDRVPLTDAEMATAIRRLRRSGLTLRAIADRLQVSERIVARETFGIPRGTRDSVQQRGGVAA